MDLNYQVTDDYYIIEDLKKYKYLIPKCDDIHAVNNTALRCAACNGHLKMVKYLISKGADIHTYNDNPLRCAALSGHLEVVKYLISKGADIHADNDYALKLAALKGHLEVTLYLKRIYSKKYRDEFLCHNCLVYPMCMKICSDKILKG